MGVCKKHLQIESSFAPTEMTGATQTPRRRKTRERERRMQALFSGVEKYFRMGGGGG